MVSRVWGECLQGDPSTFSNDEKAPALVVAALFYPRTVACIAQQTGSQRGQPSGECRIVVCSLSARDARAVHRTQDHPDSPHAFIEGFNPRRQSPSTQLDNLYVYLVILTNSIAPQHSDPARERAVEIPIIIGILSFFRTHYLPTTNLQYHYF